MTTPDPAQFLGEMPEPVEVARREFPGRLEIRRAYTADQMRAYALAAVQRALAAQPPHAQATAAAVAAYGQQAHVEAARKAVQSALGLRHMGPPRPDAPQQAAPATDKDSLTVAAHAKAQAYSRGHDAGWQSCEAHFKAQQAAVPERWVIARQSALDVGRGDDVRTGGRPELGYALLADAATFDSEEAARTALESAALPLGWVLMPLSRLLPDLAAAHPAAAVPAPAAVTALRMALRDMEAIRHPVSESGSLVGYFCNRLNEAAAAPADPQQPTGEPT